MIINVLPLGVRKMLCTTLITYIIEYVHVVYLNITQEFKAEVQTCRGCKIHR